MRLSFVREQNESESVGEQIDTLVQNVLIMRELLEPFIKYIQVTFEINQGIVLFSIYYYCRFVCLFVRLFPCRSKLIV